MQRATPDVLYFETGPRNSPTLTVDPGETFEVQTQLNRGPWFESHPAGEEFRRKLRGGNPSSGCVAVRGAQPGQMLTVEIGEITLDPIGFTNYRGNTGAFPGWFGSNGLGAHHKVVHIEGGKFRWDDRLELPVAPMVGFVGVASEFETYANTWATRYGGNFDVQEITTGAQVHLPVAVPDALLHIGDMHARQGDGEICGSGGIEASGLVRITPQLSVAPSSLYWPRVTNATHIGVVAQARPAEDAFRLGLEDMIRWLVEDYAFTPGDAFLYLGQVLEARVTQFVNPTFTYFLQVQRKYLPAATNERIWNRG